MSSSEVSEKIENLVGEISGLTLMEASQLAEKLKDVLGVQDMPMGVPVASAGDAPEEAKSAAQEKTVFDLYLKDCGSSKMQVIKVVKDLIKEHTGKEVGLKGAKEIVDKAPVMILEKLSKDKYEQCKKALEEVGATASDEE